ncbi:MAG: hypothetical protein A2493_03585 [Candidatus Magasanikbacteria bacterium RIFOXYC12_FULL_33_11]|uniref:Uncharacterized protein n=1 Tax=Candidatus Magasanikbacteria bacterium RIFOXYC12_FULL_33_11 TaxID=1798701 RepID=A0A1F6NRH6_9BACT|nr:MAG: hypothetical protein A2493_03585 [Candidatus Magasanikbacteria bacterium RIFOXYC12_FULL_33_11]
MTKLVRFKKFFLYTLVGSLIAAAVTAVITILIGEFNDITAKVFITLLMVMLHSLFSLLFVWEDTRKNTFEHLALFSNVLFFLIVLSFFTSFFGIWEIFSNTTIAKLYGSYFTIAFASLHVDILSKILNKDKLINKLVTANYVFIFFVIFMLQLVIYLGNKDILGDFFYRLLAAVGIVDGTLSILAIVFYKIYLQKHPETENDLVIGKKQHLSVWVWFLLIYLVIQMFSIGFRVIGRGYYY